MGRYLYRIGGIALSALFLFYLLPSFTGIAEGRLDLISKNPEGVSAFIKSFNFACLASLFNVGLSLFLALGLTKVAISSTAGKWLNLLIVPVMLGNVSIAFIGKIIFSDLAFFQQGSTVKFLTLTLLQFYQYGTLYTYLFWLIIQNLPRPPIAYVEGIRLTAAEKIKDIFLPACKDLAILLFVLNFILSFYEDAKFQLIFKASIGTNTELISQWLIRTYTSNALYSPVFANNQVLALCLIALGAAAIAIVAVSVIYTWLYERLLTRRRLFLINVQTFAGKVYPTVLLLLVTLPLVYAIGRTIVNFQFDFQTLISPLLFTTLAAIFGVAFSVVLSICLRLGWKRTLASFNRRSLVFFLLLFAMQLIPPVAIYLTGFQWLRLAGYSSEWNLKLLWLTGHAILTIPLISGFILVTHFRTSNNELSYMEAHRLPFNKIVTDCFLKRYLAEYLLTFLISFSLIWNESIINNLFSDFIPSFVSEMKMNIEGRAADYARGVNYLLVSLMIAAAAVLLWRSILKKIDPHHEIT
ncbi:hypothetical protein HQ865_00765 [Mucilaginibacter mali]|uniref:ABC transmembrane type-1 domain-containing protein n=1 Tax=Mucilaginibacter mali TaxID=2740462 RepID=A0A7D4QHG7_9SPHI|nr:hypothetical protein [Mucilaginibacter mali]QKJ28350.1 hypothetical protein HQ865_00765 [Mucilaginibacter mali]